MKSKLDAFTVALLAYFRALQAEWADIKAEAWQVAVEQRGAFMASDHMERGQSAGRAVNLVVVLTVGGIVAAFLLPVALDEIVAVDVSNYSSGAQSLWNILDLIIVLAVFLFFIGLAMRRRGGM